MTDLAWPQANCCMADDGPAEEHGCACPAEERALRGWQDGQKMPPMTPEQREYCLEQIGQVEGYRREDYEAEADPDLARGVLNAWTDYCRDKGLL